MAPGYRSETHPSPPKNSVKAESTAGCQVVPAGHRGPRAPHADSCGAISFHFEPQRMVFDGGFFLPSFLAPARERKAGRKSSRTVQQHPGQGIPLSDLTFLCFAQGLRGTLAPFT